MAVARLLLALLAAVGLPGAAPRPLLPRWFAQLETRHLPNQLPGFESRSTTLRTAPFALPAQRTLTSQMNNSSSSLVTIATQCSIERAHELAPMARTWAQRISAAVLISDGPDRALAFLLRLRQCSADVLHHVDIQLVFADTEQFARPESDARLFAATSFDDWNASASALPTFATASCGSILELGLLGDADSRQRATYAHAVPYPNNFLRNVARRGVTTLLSMVLDADMVPGPGLAAAVHAAAEEAVHAGRDTEHLAFVVPGLMTRQVHACATILHLIWPSRSRMTAFELREGVPYPATVAQLLQFWNSGDIRVRSAFRAVPADRGAAVLRSRVRQVPCADALWTVAAAQQ